MALLSNVLIRAAALNVVQFRILFCRFCSLRTNGDVIAGISGFWGWNHFRAPFDESRRSSLPGQQCDESPLFERDDFFPAISFPAALTRLSLRFVHVIYEAVFLCSTLKRIHRCTHTPVSTVTAVFARSKVIFQYVYNI